MEINKNKVSIYMIIGALVSFIFLVLAIVVAVNINKLHNEQIKTINDLSKTLNTKLSVTNLVLPPKLIVVKNIGITLAVFNAILFTFFIYKLIKQQSKKH